MGKNWKTGEITIDVKAELYSDPRPAVAKGEDRETFDELLCLPRVEASQQEVKLIPTDPMGKAILRIVK